MSITLTWNGGQSAAMFTPNSRLILAGLIIFSLGFFFAGAVALALFVGVGLLLWNVGALLLSLSLAMLSTDFFVKVVALIILGTALCSAILMLVRSCVRVWRAECAKEEESSHGNER